MFPANLRFRISYLLTLLKEVRLLWLSFKSVSRSYLPHVVVVPWSRQMRALSVIS